VASLNKKEVREKFKLLRARQPGQEALAKSSQIQDVLLELPEFRNAKTVSFYVTKPGSGEVDTEHMIKASLRMGKRVLLPVVEKTAKRLALSELMDFEAELAPGAFNVPEPKPEYRRPTPASECDLIIVPGVAFDLHGHRLGFGGGYYDRFLREVASLRLGIPFVGLAYELQVVDSLPHTGHDVAVHILVTEKRILRFRAPIHHPD
jgi:5-formyltetrahydrofolate cyclo-ligase